MSDKEHEEQLLLHQWKDLVKKVTHQEAVWPLPNVIARPLLDATEGELHRFSSLVCRVRRASALQTVLTLLATGTTRMRIRLKPTLTRPLDKLFKEDGEPLEWLSPSTRRHSLPHTHTRTHTRFLTCATLVFFLQR